MKDATCGRRRCSFRCSSPKQWPGAGALLVLAPLFDAGHDVTTALLWALVGGTSGLLALVAVELTSRGTAAVELGLAAMTRGEHAVAFWALAVGIGGGAAGARHHRPRERRRGLAVTVAAGGAALVGLYPYEDAFVRAGQAVPLS